MMPDGRFYSDESLYLLVSYDQNPELVGGDNPMYANNAITQQFVVPQLLWRNVDPAIFTRRFFYRAIISTTSLEDISRQMEHMRNRLLNDGDVYVITHGDDQLCAIMNTNPNKYNGRLGIVYIEGDINDNDGSHVDDFYRLDFLTFVSRGEVPTDAFSQLANPLLLTNPNDVEQYGIFRRRYGMQMCSGSVHTTYGNSKMSANVGLTLLFSDGAEYEVLARGVGMTVTTLVGNLTDVTFLSKNFYNVGENIKAYTDLASLLRKLGRATGDVFGSNKIPIDIRFDHHNEGVVKGWVHEPESMLLNSLREKYITSKPKYCKYFGMWIRTNPLTSFQVPNFRKVEFSNLELAYIDHYYSPDEKDLGLTEYQTLLDLICKADNYGVLIKSKFIDRIMQRRYGMTPVVTP